MRKMLFLLALLAAPLSVASAQCPISGINTVSVGTGTGVIWPPQLELGFDGSTCELTVRLDARTCCNTFVSGHIVGLGSRLLSLPAPLGGKFLPGSLLLIEPTNIAPMAFGLTSRIPVPPNPALVGRNFVAQAVPFYFTTIGMRTQLGITQAIQGSFQ